MAETIETIENATRLICGMGLLAIGVFFLALAVCRAFAPVVRRVKRRGRIEAAFVAALAAGMAYYGGSKGWIDYPRTDADMAYIFDNGSYVSNDVVHVDFTRAVAVPESAGLEGWYRDCASTNDEDWLQWFASTFAEFSVPTNIPFANATNYNFQIFTTWTPGPAVHTNGLAVVVWDLVDGSTNTVRMLRTKVYPSTP